MGRAPMAQPPGSETRARPERATSGPRTRLEARMVLTSSYGASGQTMFSVRSRTVSSSTSTLVPISTRSRSMVRMSRTRGTRCSVTGSAVSSVAANAGSAEFFEPLVGISPRSAAPPVMTNLSMVSSRSLFAERARHASTGRGETPFGFLARHACLAHHDRGSHAIAGRAKQFARALVRDARGLRDDAAGALHQFVIRRLDVHHQVSVHVAQPDERLRGEHVEHQFLRGS